MWFVVIVLVTMVISAHVLMFFVIKAGLKEAEKANRQKAVEQDTLEKAGNHWSKGFQQPFPF